MKFLPDLELSGIKPRSTEATITRLIEMGIQVTSNETSTEQLVEDDTGASLEVVTDQTEPWMYFNGALYKLNAPRFARSMILLSLHEGALTAFDLARYGVYDVIDVFKASEQEEDRDSLSVYRAKRLFDSPDFPVKDAFPGATVLLGLTGAGKTYYINNKLGADIVVRYGEPMEDVDGGPSVLSVDTIADVFSVCAVLSAHGTKLAVDSIRPLVYNMKGNAGTGGVSTGMYIALTSITNFFAAFGGNVLLAVNPLLTDDEKASDLYHIMAAAVAGAIFIERREIAAEQHRLTTGRVMTSGSNRGSGQNFDRGIQDDKIIKAAIKVDQTGGPLENAAVNLGEESRYQPDEKKSDPRFDQGPAALSSL